MSTLIAEDLLLLLLDDESGRLVPVANMDALLCGALPSELELAERINPIGD